MLEGESSMLSATRSCLKLLMWFTWVFGVAGVLFAQTAPPVAPVRNVVDNYFGSKITDPYRWMEDMNSPELQAWMKAQNDYTRVIIDSIPGRQKLLESIVEHDNARTSVVDLAKYGDRYFYRMIEPNQDNFKLYMRDAKTGQERMLVDPDRFKPANETAHYALDYIFPSWDGKYVAYGVSPGGSENSTLRIFDVDAGHDLPEAIDRCQYPSVSWLDDNKSFLYTRLQKVGPNDPPTAKYLDSQALWHKVGESPEQDVLLLSRKDAPAIPLVAADFPTVAYSPASPWVIAAAVHGVQREFPVFAAKLSDLKGAKTQWKKVADDADEVTGFDMRGDDLYLLTHHQASRFKIVRVDMRHPDMANAKIILPAAEPVLVQHRVAKDGLYVQELDGGIGKMVRVGFNGGTPQSVQLPFDGSISEFFADPHQPGAILQAQSWVRPPMYLQVGEDRKTTDLNLIPKPSFDYSQLESAELKAPASDGTMIPLSIVYKRGAAKDGKRPTLLEGYGSYGITIDPTFSPRYFPWLERGGVLAFAHVRGGGEYGEDWHNGGRKLTKQNTIGDMIACAEYLVTEKYTSPAYLAGEGGSAGGITVGGALTQRPDLFAAMLDDVGDTDGLRMEYSPGGPANIPEFGSVKTEEGFKGLYIMDAYVHVKDGTPYPAVMLTTGVNDPRVDPWQAAKMTARLQAATSSGKPILLRVDYDAGHGFGSGKKQRAALLADELSFLLWQFGDSDFQPPKWKAEK
jgi:prolyl oligopeptidase